MSFGLKEKLTTVAGLTAFGSLVGLGFLHSVNTAAHLVSSAAGMNILVDSYTIAQASLSFVSPVNFVISGAVCGLISSLAALSGRSLFLSDVSTKTCIFLGAAILVSSTFLSCYATCTIIGSVVPEVINAGMFFSIGTTMLAAIGLKGHYDLSPRERDSDVSERVFDAMART